MLLEAFRSIERRGALDRRTGRSGSRWTSCGGWRRRRGAACGSSPRFVPDSELPAYLSPRRPGGAPAPRRRAVGRPLRGARVRQGDRDERRRGIRARSPRTAPGGSCLRGPARRSGERDRGPARRSGARERLAASAREAADRAVLVGPVAEQTWRSTGSSGGDRRIEIAFWVVRGPARLHPPRLSGAAVGARPGSCGRREPQLRGEPPPRVTSDRRGTRRGGGHPGQAPRGRRARLPPRTASR